jgi:hypothetical protein
MVIAGILFDSSLLREPWVLTLGAFVAFNTLLYVGLSFGKILYWPKPLSPQFFDSLRRKESSSRDESLPSRPSGFESNTDR